MSNDNPKKGYKVTLTFPGMENGKIDGAQGNSKQVELRAGGGKAEIFIRPAESGKELSITKISSSLVEVNDGAKQGELPEKWVSFVDKVWPRYDLDKSNTLSKAECLAFVKNTFPPQPPAAFERMWTPMDNDKSGSVSKFELISYLRDNCK